MTKQILIALVLVIAVGAWLFAYRDAIFTRSPQTGEQQVGTVVASFICSGNKSIVAAFTADQAALQLSDNRTVTLAHAVSADGARYANADESFVFWSKGNTAFITEGGKDTFTGCIVAARAPEGWLPYANTEDGFSISHPVGYTANAGYSYEALGPGKAISGVSFTVPAATAEGTNLSKDSHISVETMPTASGCSASQFLEGNPVASAITDSGVEYSVATSSGAGAGNRYDDAVFAIPGTIPCTAVRYFVHSTVVENYPAGTVRAFDATALITEFDTIRRTLVIGR